MALKEVAACSVGELQPVSHHGPACRTVCLCIVAAGVNARICRDESARSMTRTVQNRNIWVQVSCHGTPVVSRNIRLSGNVFWTRRTADVEWGDC